MRKLYAILIATLLLTSISANAEQPVLTKEDSLWESLKNNYLDQGFHLTTFPGDIKIQLTGNYKPEDTVYVDALAEELSGIITRSKIYRVKSHGNLVLKVQTLPDSVYDGNIPKYPDWVFEKIKNNKTLNQFLKDPKYKHLPEARSIHITKSIIDSVSLEDIMTNKVSGKRGLLEMIWRYYIRFKDSKVEQNEKGVKFVNINILVRQTAPDIIRNKAIQFYIIQQLIIPNRTKKGIVNVNDHSILGSVFPINSHLQEKDRFLLSKAYSNDIYLQLYFKYPGLYFKSLKHKFGNYSLILCFAISIMLILLYLLILIKLNKITSISSTWTDYIKSGMLIMQSATIMYFIYKIYEGTIIREHSLSLWSEVIVIPNIFSFICLNFFYFSEKLLIKKNATIIQRLYIQLIISLIPVFFFFFKYHWDTLFINFVLVYGFVMITGRLAYTYFNFKTINAINEKDLEITHFREMQHSAELQALHSRFNPHFLYNSLNSIAGLAKVDPDKTEKMAIALSEFFRYSINKNNGTYSTVNEEAHLANIYIDIEKVRFGDKLQFVYEASEEVKDMKIPRFIIQPLIENAIKHGVTQITGKGIVKLVINMRDNTLIIEVYDNGPAFSNTPTKGIGLQSIHDKLEILYKGKAHINWQNEPEKFISVVIPIE
jgi:two-component system LytT family sensor kinase